MQRRLAVEQHNVAVNEVSLDHVAWPQRRCQGLAVRHVLEEHLAAVGRLQVVGARMLLGAVDHVLTHPLEVVLENTLRVRQSHGDLLGHRDFVDAQVGVGRDDRARRKVDTLPG